MPPVLFCASREMYTASTRPKMPPPGSALLPQRSWHGSAVPRGNVLQSTHIGQDRTPNKCRSMKCVRTRKPSTAARHARGKETHALRDPSHAYSIRRSSFRDVYARRSTSAVVYSDGTCSRIRSCAFGFHRSRFPGGVNRISIFERHTNKFTIRAYL